MPRGGKREGAGRKKGSGTRRTSKATRLALDAAAGGALPLQVMLEAMRAHHAAGRLDDAASIAKDAAPYIHPRLSAVAHAVGGDPNAPPVRVSAEQVAALPAEDQARLMRERFAGWLSGGG